MYNMVEKGTIITEKDIDVALEKLREINFSFKPSGFFGCPFCDVVHRFGMNDEDDEFCDEIKNKLKELSTA